MEIQAGNIGLANYTGKNFLSSAIRFFTHVKGVPDYTHGYIGLGPVRNFPSIIEASYDISTQAWRKFISDKGESCEVYELQGINPMVLNTALDNLYYDKAETIYGFLAILWWVWAWFLRLFGIELSGKHNPLPYGIFCTKLVWQFLASLNDTEIWEHLQKWGSDNFAPVNLKQLIMELPHRFKRIDNV